jgi:hypothetical protein
MRLVSAVAGVMLLAGCASGPQINGGPRPPQGPGPAGTEFGYWNRDAEGSVDAEFRSFIMGRYNAGDEAKARKDLETDGFTCQDGNRPDGAPVPDLQCDRLFKLNDDVHAWTVEFWPSEKEPRAHYTRTHIRDPLHNYDDKKAKG